MAHIIFSLTADFCVNPYPSIQYMYDMLITIRPALSMGITRPIRLPFQLNLLALRPEYSRSTRSFLQLLLPKFLVSLTDQLSMYSPCRINRSISFMRNDLSYLHYVTVGKWCEMLMNIYNFCESIEHVEIYTTVARVVYILHNWPCCW